ncbi:MAG: 8-amino-7-oxononanoate synthase [Magnetococcales bacterium]|nr:8-amino-7-oxononanoate synthase [Magnetococcales bacterium]MBF0115426.1 8-amino-7-oxononanoate synthase [Magnetococcales bacterium]
MPVSAYYQFCQQRRSSNRWRQLRPVDSVRGGTISVDNQVLLNFSSNNYMGLSTHPELVQRAIDWTTAWGCGATASRLVCGNLVPFIAIEEKLACSKGSEAALLFNSGFQANSAILTALLDRRVLGAEPIVFTDRLNHASLHHGCHCAGVHQIRYRHNDLDHLHSLLQQHAHRRGPRFIVSETVFSMDGDCCDVPALLAMKEQYGAFLYLDEAHATGVMGRGGLGLSAAYADRVDLVMGTFSKGLGSFGAYVTCSQKLKEYLINACGGFIYATALPPAVLGAMDAALDLLPTLEQERERLQRNAQWVRDRWQEVGVDTGLSSTQIIPWIVGSEQRAMHVSSALEQQGILAVAIRPPTVPPGQSRIRFSLTALHNQEMLDRLVNTVVQLHRTQV